MDLKDDFIGDEDSDESDEDDEDGGGDSEAYAAASVEKVTLFHSDFFLLRRSPRSHLTVCFILSVRCMWRCM